MDVFNINKKTVEWQRVSEESGEVPMLSLDGNWKGFHRTEPSVSEISLKVKACFLEGAVCFPSKYDSHWYDVCHQEPYV